MIPGVGCCCNRPGLLGDGENVEDFGALGKKMAELDRQCVLGRSSKNLKDSSSESNVDYGRARRQFFCYFVKEYDTFCS